MATQVTTTYTASYELSLVNTEDAEDTTTRTLSFDVLDSTTAESVSAGATLFTQAGMSNVFQPTGWRDYQGNFDVYKVIKVKPKLTEKTVQELDEIIINN